MCTRGSQDQGKIERNWTKASLDVGDGIIREKNVRAKESVQASWPIEALEERSPIATWRPDQPRLIEFSLEGCALANVSTLCSHMV